MLGTNDLAKETRAQILPGRAPMLPWLSTCLLAAREYGIDVLDGVFNDIANTQGLQGGMRAGARHGLRRQDADPSEPDRAVQRGVLADADEVAAARKMIAAFDLPENKDKGVVQIDGRMVERMHAEMARRTVAIADAIAARALAASSAHPRASGYPVLLSPGSPRSRGRAETCR